MTAYNDKAKWLRRYLDDVRYLLPKDGKPIVAVKIIKPPGGYTRVAGYMYDHYFDLKFTVVLHSHMRRITKPKGPWELIQLPTIEILEIFGHELAHLGHAEHTPEHQIMTGHLTNRFMRILKKEGFRSMEKDGEHYY